MLYLVGIYIDCQSGGSLNERFAAVMSDLQKLSPDKRALFDALKKKFIDDERLRDEQEEAAALEEQRKAEEHANLLAQMSDKKRQLLANMDKNAPIDELPDCQHKFEKIEEEFGADNENKFVDVNFDHNDPDKILGK